MLANGKKRFSQEYEIPSWIWDSCYSPCLPRTNRRFSVSPVPPSRTIQLTFTRLLDLWPHTHPPGHETRASICGARPSSPIDMTGRASCPKAPVGAPGSKGRPTPRKCWSQKNYVPQNVSVLKSSGTGCDLPSGAGAAEQVSVTFSHPSLRLRGAQLGAVWKKRGREQEKGAWLHAPKQVAKQRTQLLEVQRRAAARGGWLAGGPQMHDEAPWQFLLVLAGAALAAVVGSGPAETKEHRLVLLERGWAPPAATAGQAPAGASPPSPCRAGNAGNASECKGTTAASRRAGRAGVTGNYRDTVPGAIAGKQHIGFGSVLFPGVLPRRALEMSL